MKTAQQLKKLWETSPDDLVAALTKTLKDFGYGVSSQYIKETITKVYAGEKVVGGPAMFIEGWLKDGID